MTTPIMVAPTGLLQLAHPEGEVAVARAAAACNTLMVLSFSSNCTIEDVASGCDAIRFYQLYIYKQRDVCVKLVKRAERNGFKAIVLTVDTPRFGRREADIKNKFVIPKFSNLEGLLSAEIEPKGGSLLEAFASATHSDSLNWKDIEWLRSITNLPILVKGILTAEDARKAVEAGVAGIIVSNHGARQLDYVPASISALEEVVRVVSGAVPIIVDGGFRRGTDIFKALALGANAVMIGRPVIYGLAAKGEYGVRRVIKMLQNELELTMALSGCPSLSPWNRNQGVPWFRPMGACHVVVGPTTTQKTKKKKTKTPTPANGSLPRGSEPGTCLVPKPGKMNPKFEGYHQKPCTNRE